jgi:hypothetical protein
MKGTRRDPSQAGDRVQPFLSIRRQQIDWLGLMHRQHTIHALLEVDVTGARLSIRKCRKATGAPLSFTAFIVWCVAQAVFGQFTLGSVSERVLRHAHCSVLVAR